MEKELLQLKGKIIDALKETQIIVDDVNYHKDGTLSFLEVVLDKDGGIDLDTIVDATNIINPIVDEMDFIDESFILDVVSKERGDV